MCAVPPEAPVLGVILWGIRPGFSSARDPKRQAGLRTPDLACPALPQTASLALGWHVSRK